VNYLSENPQKIPSEYLKDIIIPMNLSNPHLSLKKFVPFLKKKVLNKLKTPRNEHSNKPLYSLIKTSNIASIFEQYELNIVNRESLLWYINLIEDMLSYTSPAILDYKDDFELILYHVLMHEEFGAFERAAQCFHKLLLSLLSVFPTNLGHSNPEELTKDEFFNFYKRIGKMRRQDIELVWHHPSEKEIEYAKDLYTQLLDNNMAYLEKTYFGDLKEEKFDYETASKLIDSMHLKVNTESPVAREELTRSSVLTTVVSLGVLQRSSMACISKEHPIRERFEKKFMLDFCNDTRIKVLNHLKKYMQYTAQHGLLGDSLVGIVLVTLMSCVIGEDTQ